MLPEITFRWFRHPLLAETKVINALNLLKEFADLIQKLALANYPLSNRKKRTVKGSLPSPALEYSPLLIRIELKKRNPNLLDEIPKIPVRVWSPDSSISEQSLCDFTYQIIQEENALFLIVSGSPMEIKAIMQALHQKDGILVRSISQIFG